MNDIMNGKGIHSADVQHVLEDNRHCLRELELSHVLSKFKWFDCLPLCISLLRICLVDCHPSVDKEIMALAPKRCQVIHRKSTGHDAFEKEFVSENQHEVCSTVLYRIVNHKP
jgi:hypothetical protein